MSAFLDLESAISKNNHEGQRKLYEYHIHEHMLIDNTRTDEGEWSRMTELGIKYGFSWKGCLWGQT